MMRHDAQYIMKHHSTLNLESTMNTHEIDDGYEYGLCTRHAEPAFMTHVHTSAPWTDEDIDIMLSRPGMNQQECILEFQMRDFDAFAMHQRFIHGRRH
jgi:hypothetical protein